MSTTQTDGNLRIEATERGFRIVAYTEEAARFIEEVIGAREGTRYTVQRKPSDSPAGWELQGERLEWDI